MASDDVGTTGFDPMSAVNPHVRSLTTSLIRRFDREVSPIPGILKLTLGEPDFDTPEFIKRSAGDSLRRNRTHYAPNAGTEGLREAISSYLSRRRGLSYPREDIVVTEGASEAISSVLTALLHPGAILLYATPGFGLYRSMADIMGASPRPIDTTGTGFALTAEDLDHALGEAAGHDTVLVLNSPSNPTGVTLNEKRLKELAEVIESHDVIVVSDEVYAEISYETRPAPSIARFAPDRTVLVDSASKSFAMTGWRIGYFAAPHELSAQLAKVHQTHVATAATFVMDAAQTAYEQGDTAIDDMVRQYRERRDYLLGAFTDLGLRTARPTGAFYLYVAVPDAFPGSGLDYAQHLARDARVAAIPGEAFVDGPSRNIRFSYAAGIDTLHEAVRRMTPVVAKDLRGQGDVGIPYTPSRTGAGQ